jgi:hypothetical protein
MKQIVYLVKQWSLQLRTPRSYSDIQFASYILLTGLYLQVCYSLSQDVNQLYTSTKQH